jgi:hypothetical protein
MFKAALLLALVSAVSANVFPTEPVAATSWQAGVTQTIRWQESKEPPTLAQFGSAKISIYVGNARQQTMLQSIAAAVDVSKVNTVTFTPNPTIGPDSDEYFIRFESNSFKDPAQPQFPALAFSSKFRLTGMTGQFNATVQAQIDGQTTAPIGGSSASRTSTATSTGSAGAATGTSTKTSAAASKSATQTGNAAVNIQAGWISALISTVAGVAML